MESSGLLSLSQTKDERYQKDYLFVNTRRNVYLDPGSKNVTKAAVF